MFQPNPEGFHQSAGGVNLIFERPTEEALDDVAALLLHEQPWVFLAALYDAMVAYTQVIQEREPGDRLHEEAHRWLREMSMIWKAVYGEANHIEVNLTAELEQDEVLSALAWAMEKEGLDPVQRLRAIDSLAELEDLTPEHTRKSGDIRLGRSLLLVMPKTILQVLAKARQAHRKARPEGALSENEAIRGLETSLVYGLLGRASGSIPMGVSFEDLLSLVHNWAGHQQSAAMDRLGL